MYLKVFHIPPAKALEIWFYFLVNIKEYEMQVTHTRIFL
jgi:hypothetical protein